MAREHAVKAEAARLTIEDWRTCLAQCDSVVAVEPLVHADGAPKKSPVPESAVAAGGGHLSPYELCVYVGSRTKAQRVTMGFTKNRGFLHTYFRTPPQRLGEKQAADVFREACKRFDAMAEAPQPRGLPPAPSRPPPSPSPASKSLYAWDGPSADYLTLQVGDSIAAVFPPAGIAACGWAFGRNLRSGTVGWYPPDFVSS